MSLIEKRTEDDFIKDYLLRTSWTKNLKVPELRDELEQRGQSREGLKVILAHRLDEHIKSTKQFDRLSTPPLPKRILSTESEAQISGEKKKSKGK